MGFTTRLRPRLAFVCQGMLLAILIVPSLSGCAALGLAARAFPLPTVPAKYTELHGQTVAVMVWTERGIRIDWPQIQLDVATGVQQVLQQAAKDKKHELDGARFPLTAAAVVQMQDEHPEWAADSIEEVAPRLGVSRVIYIEIENFQTRSDASTELYKGSIGGRLRVIEVNDGKSRVALSEDNIQNTFPPKGPEEGTPNKNDYDIYRETLKAFTTSITNLFLPYQAEED
jgi:hypothetical protein